MLIAAALLTIAAAVAPAASAPTQQQLEEDCHIVKRETPAAKPRPRPRVLTQLLAKPAASAPIAKRKPLQPKVDEEIICDDVRRLPPLTAALEPEIPAEFTPMPAETFAELALPSLDQPLASEPCDCFAEGSGGRLVAWWPTVIAGGGVWIITRPGQVPAIPEPSTWALLAGGLLIFGLRGAWQ